MIKLKKSDKTKQVFHYMDPKLSIDRLVIEKYKAGKIVYYPFRIQRDGKIIDKYKKINKIVIELDGKIPGKGLARSIRGGCGLTKVMNPLIYFLEDKFPTITDINIQKKVSSKIDGNTFKLNIKDYFTFFRKSQSYINTEKENRNVFINNYLADLLPATFSKRKNQYTDGVISRTLDGMQNIKLSAEDQKSLLDILSSSTIDKSFYLLKSKEVINEKYIEEVIGEYKGLLEQKTETTTLEKKRQSFFKEHSRILSQVLALPVVYFKKEAYVGGKGLDNKGGKVIDFLYQNKLISNLVLVEVKTHKTPIFNKSPIRGDDVDGQKGGILLFIF